MKKENTFTVMRQKNQFLTFFGSALAFVAFLILTVSMVSCKKETQWLVGGKVLPNKYIIQDQIFGRLPELSCENVFICKNEGESLELSCKNCETPLWTIINPKGVEFQRSGDQTLLFEPDYTGTWLVRGKENTLEVAFYFVVRKLETQPPIEPFPAPKELTTEIHPEESAPITEKAQEQPPVAPNKEPNPESPKPSPKEPPIETATVKIPSRTATHHGYICPLDPMGCISKWVEKTTLIVKTDKDCLLYQGVVWADGAGSLSLTLSRSNGKSRSMRQQVNGGQLQLRLADLAPDMDAGEQVKLIIEAKGCKIADMTGCGPALLSRGFISLEFDPDGITLFDLVVQSTL